VGTTVRVGLATAAVRLGGTAVAVAAAGVGVRVTGEVGLADTAVLVGPTGSTPLVSIVVAKFNVQ
jgi:hypothetical protein